MPQYRSNGTKMSLKHDSSTDTDDSNYNDRDPGREVIEKNLRSRLQRIADHTKEELNKVLKRVDTTLNNYEYSVQASLIQHGMSHNDMSNVEQVADIKELENLLNDSIAKQRYKQRLMIFIVGQTEQASEKAKLLQQIEQFFTDQKQSFSGNEFNNYDDERPDEVDATLKSFDVKDCYIHVKTLGTRLNELNEEIMQYLIQNAGTKQQTKGKKKLAQVTKETKEQLASLQSKLETANTEMIGKDNKIETLEKEIETIRAQMTINQEILQGELNQCKIEIESYQTRITESEDMITQYLNEIDDLTKTVLTSGQSKTAVTAQTTNTDLNITEQTDNDESQLPTTPTTATKFPAVEKLDKEIQTSHQSITEATNTEDSNEISRDDQTILSDNNEDSPDLNLLFKSTDDTDLNNIPTDDLPIIYTNLRKFAIIRVRELLRELEIKESINNETVQNLKQEFNEQKIIYEKEQNFLIEKADNAYQLQIKAQEAAEEALNHLKSYIDEHEDMETSLVHEQTLTDQQDPIQSMTNITSSPEHTNPIEESINDRRSSSLKVSSIENFRRASLKEKYMSLFEEKKTELDHLKEQADVVLSRSPTTMKERTSIQSLENSTVLIKHQSSFSSLDNSDNKENQAAIKQDQQQQTSQLGSQHSSTNKEKNTTEMIQIDEFKIPFFHLYEIIYKFRHTIISLLEQNQFISFADRLQMVKQLSSDDNNQTNDFVENSERVLKDIGKVLQTCMATLTSTINELQIKQKEISTEPETLVESSIMDNQQSFILEQKESIISNLTTKYEQITKDLDQTHKKYEEESKLSQRLINDQEKLIQTLQQELVRAQKRLTKIETEGMIEPSILFTRLDAERNEQTLQQALSKGKVPETAYSDINEAMTDYVRLPSQQLSNLVKQYIQFRKATELEDRIQSEVFDTETKSVLEKMQSLHKRRSSQLSERMSHIRQHRVNLAKALTEEFDHLEDESSVFLIRPIYSYQGRNAAQSYMKLGKRRQGEALLNANVTKKKHQPSRQSISSQSAKNQRGGKQQMPTTSSSISTSDDEERLFHIEKSFTTPRSTPTRQQDDSPNNNAKAETKQITVQLSELTRLQEYDFQRALMPVSHASTPLLSAFTNNVIDPAVPSLNLRSYVALSRPGIGNVRMGKPTDLLRPVSRDALSAVSRKSLSTNPRTPFNSSAGDLKRASPPLPPIKRSLTVSVSPAITEEKLNEFIQSMNTNQVTTAN